MDTGNPFPIAQVRNGDAPINKAENLGDFVVRVAPEEALSFQCSVTVTGVRAMARRRNRSC